VSLLAVALCLLLAVPYGEPQVAAGIVATGGTVLSWTGVGAMALGAAGAPAGVAGTALVTGVALSWNPVGWGLIALGGALA